METVQAGTPMFGDRENRIPDQGAISKDPKILVR
jgi:hypothetical protein